MMAKVSKYLNQTKVVNEITYSTIEYKNSKVKTVAEGYEGEMWVSTQTWKNYDNNDKTTKRSGFHSESKRFKESFTKIVEVVKEVVKEVKEVVEEVMCGLEDDLKAFDNYIAHMFCTIACNEGEKALKRVYRQVSKKYHPDVCKHPNSTKLMEIINECYHEIKFI